jgi:hypothetical protein
VKMSALGGVFVFVGSFSGTFLRRNVPLLTKKRVTHYFRVRRGVLIYFAKSCGDDVKILPRRRLHVETCTERQNFNVLPFFFQKEQLLDLMSGDSEY